MLKTQTDSAELLCELERFFEVALVFTSQTGDQAFMPRCLVDAAWHDLLKDTTSYEAFCVRAVDGYIDHREVIGEGALAWTVLYEDRFGDLPRVWFTAPDGQFHRDAWDAYKSRIAGDVVRASWDCSPGFRPKPPLKASWDCTPYFPSRTRDDPSQLLATRN